MKNKRWVPRVGEVVRAAEREYDDMPYYGKVKVIRGDLLILDGWTFNFKQVRPLTKRERGSR